MEMQLWLVYAIRSKHLREWHGRLKHLWIHLVQSSFGTCPLKQILRLFFCHKHTLIMRTFMRISNRGCTVSVYPYPTALLNQSSLMRLCHFQLQKDLFPEKNLLSALPLHHKPNKPCDQHTIKWIIWCYQRKILKNPYKCANLQNNDVIHLRCVYPLRKYLLTFCRISPVIIARSSCRKNLMKM